MSETTVETVRAIVNGPAEPDTTGLLNDRITSLVVEKTDAELQIEKLKAELQVTRIHLARAIDEHRSDVEKIGEAMMDAAGEHGHDSSYCEDYDNAVNALNRVLKVALPLRPQQRMLVFTVSVPVRCTDDELDEVRADAQDELEQAGARVDRSEGDSSVSYSHEEDNTGHPDY